MYGAPVLELQLGPMHGHGELGDRFEEDVHFHEHIAAPNGEHFTARDLLHVLHRWCLIAQMLGLTARVCCRGCGLR